jgi:hypothetical protein
MWYYTYMAKPNIRIPASDRFWNNVQKTDFCWIWTGMKQKSGYGRFSYNGRKWRANRLAWIFSIGLIPDGLHVLHTCDNPACVNPNHLWLGTHQDNVDDRERKGRNKPPRGEANPRHALIEKEVIEIRMALNKNKSPSKLAEMYRVSRATIHNIKTRRTWAHI